MKIKTAELKGRALDWALAKALGRTVEVCFGGVVGVQDESGSWQAFAVHTDPALCLGLMSKISIMQQATDGSWRVATSKGVIIEGCVSTRHYELYGKTLAEAVARCVVQMRLGDEVEVPDELVGVRS